MTTFFAFRTFRQNVSSYRRFANGIEFLGIFDAENEQQAVLNVCQKHDDSNYLPNENETEVADCDGNVIWETGDTSIDMGDYTYGVYTELELLELNQYNELYNADYLNAIAKQADYEMTENMSAAL